MRDKHWLVILSDVPTVFVVVAVILIVAARLLVRAEPEDILVNPDMIVEELPPHLGGAINIVGERIFHRKFSDEDRKIYYQEVDRTIMPHWVGDIKSIDYPPEFDNFESFNWFNADNEFVRICDDTGRLFEINILNASFVLLNGKTCPLTARMFDESAEPRLGIVDRPTISPDGRYTVYATRHDADQPCPNSEVNGALLVNRYDNETGLSTPLICGNEEQTSVSFWEWVDNTLLIEFEVYGGSDLSLGHSYVLNVDSNQIKKLGTYLENTQRMHKPSGSLARMRVIEFASQGLPERCILNIVDYATFESTDLGAETACSQPAEIRVSHSDDTLLYLTAPPGTSDEQRLSRLVRVDLGQMTVVETSIEERYIAATSDILSDSRFDALIIDRDEDSKLLKYPIDLDRWISKDWGDAQLAIYDLTRDEIVYETTLSIVEPYDRWRYLVGFMSDGWYIVNSDETFVIADSTGIHERILSAPVLPSATVAFCVASPSPDEAYSLIRCTDNAIYVLVLETGQVIPLVHARQLTFQWVEAAWQDNYVVIEVSDYSDDLASTRWLIDPFRN